MVAPGFDADFTSLPVTGWITVPPTFESDGVLLVATTGGMERISLAGATADAGSIRPVVFVPPAMGEEVTAAAAPGSSVTFVITGAGERLIMFGAAGVGTQEIDSAGGVPELYSCPARGQCSRIGPSPTLLVAGLTVSPSYATDHALVAYGTKQDIHLSTDSGMSFTTLPDPGLAVAWAAPATVNGVVVVWAVMARSGSWTVMQWDRSGGWHAVSPPSWHPAAYATVHALLLAADRVVVFPDGAPTLCTADDGHTWATVCPS
jgi:hypothetical protein